MAEINHQSRNVFCGSATYAFGLFRAIPKTAGWKPRATERSTAFASRMFKASISRWVKKRLEFRTTVCPSRRPEHCYVQSKIVNLQSARPAGLSPAVSVAPAPEARQENPDSRFQMRHHQTIFVQNKANKLLRINASVMSQKFVEKFSSGIQL